MANAITILTIAVIGLMMLAGFKARLGSRLRETVQVRNLRVIDGDTIWIADTRGRIVEKMRLATIDAPETHGWKSLWQNRAGLAAKDALTRILQRCGSVEVERMGFDRYGRTLVRLYGAQGDRTEIGIQLAQAGHARRWT